MDEERAGESSHEEAARREAWSPIKTDATGAPPSWLEPRVPSRHPPRPKSARPWGARVDLGTGVDEQKVSTAVAGATVARRRPQTAGAARRGSKSKRIEFFNKELSHHAARVDVEVGCVFSSLLFSFHIFSSHLISSPYSSLLLPLPPPPPLLEINDLRLEHRQTGEQLHENPWALVDGSGGALKMRKLRANTRRGGDFEIKMRIDPFSPRQRIVFREEENAIDKEQRAKARGEPERGQSLSKNSLHKPKKHSPRKTGLRFAQFKHVPGSRLYGACFCQGEERKGEEGRGSEGRGEVEKKVKEEERRDEQRSPRCKYPMISPTRDEQQTTTVRRPEPALSRALLACASTRSRG